MPLLPTISRCIRVPKSPLGSCGTEAPLSFFFSSRRRHTRCGRDWSSDVCSSDLPGAPDLQAASDSGVSSTDNITNDSTPTFDVTATPYFRFYRGTTLISGAYQSGDRKSVV